MKKPGFIISGTNSGCGKTTVTAGIIAALVKRGLKVQPFKAGPDFIDPMFHTFLAGRFSRNLDSWMLDEDMVRHLYAKNSRDADIAVVEGVMGLFDGSGGLNEAGSTAHVARLTGMPVILVADPEGMALSAAALVKGFTDFDRAVSVKGVIFNNINSREYFMLLKKYVEEHTDVRVLGYLRQDGQYALGERHLGLKTAAEIDDLKEKAEALCESVEETVDMDALLGIASEAPSIDAPEPAELKELEAFHRAAGVRIAVAYDKVFCFYYRDNLELLEQLGAELVFFSPIEDKTLPASIDGLYIGGGYPELYAGELTGNYSMRRSVKTAVEHGLPAYAECGGLMYLCRTIDDGKGGHYDMVGLIPGAARMTSSLKRFGYAGIEVMSDCCIAGRGMKIRGHEFHYSDVELHGQVETCWYATQKRFDGTTDGWYCGYKVRNLVAGYAHLHFLGNPKFAARFVENCLEYRQNRDRRER